MGDRCTHAPRLRQTSCGLIRMTSRTGVLVHGVRGGSSVAALRERFVHLFLFTTSSFHLTGTSSSTTSTRFRSLRAPINLCRKVTSTCSTRHLPPYGPRPITATAVGTWQRFSLFGRTARVASRYMDLLRRMSVIRPSNRQDVRCVVSFDRCRHFEILIKLFFKGQFTIFRVDRHGRHRIDPCIFPIPLDKSL